MAARVDPFWNDVAVAHDTAIVYPEQEITIEVGDRSAAVKYNADTDQVSIVVSKVKGEEYVIDLKGVGDA